jgi:hypothetical protein
MTNTEDRFCEVCNAVLFGDEDDICDSCRYDRNDDSWNYDDDSWDYDEED